MNHMFNNCIKLKYLNINNFSLKNNCETKNIFNNIPNECNIKVNDKILKDLLSH